MENNIKGFKVFNPDWKCRGFQYEVGQTYEQEQSPSICKTGFHFCKKVIDCFNYYKFDPNNKVAEVIALGDVSEEGDKCSTNKIRLVREIPWSEMLSMVNTGKNNSGYCNSGNDNSGNDNSGYRNSGDMNSGYRNSGDMNSGDWNSGDWNSGDWNSGHWNSGDRNSGHRNSGHRNSGDWNSGDWNKASNVAGCFNTEQHKLMFFDKETDITFEQWRGSEAYRLMNQIDFTPVKWINKNDMTEEEISEHPECETTGGYLKKYDNLQGIYKDSCINWWNRLSREEQDIIKKIPNFDAGKFFEITGIEVI